MSEEREQDRWEAFRRGGPVIATSVHSGHAVRPELAGRLALDGDARRREEDPLTDIWAGVGDDVFRAHVSRFEVDLNRPEEEAVYLEPSDAWGLEVWDERPTEEMVARSLAQRDRFYRMMSEWIDGAIAEHGRLLLLDIHSFNHRRDGPDAPPAPQHGNPDIDLGLTTADESRFGGVVEALWQGLEGEMDGRPLDVRRNVRFEDGGHWPEWVFATYGEEVCTVTLEYKKIFMDEWTGRADLGAVESLRRDLWRAVDAARAAL
ncbi:N-formylglutamate amidohydrolase [Roseitranquillus sediminis]|uniref:N-formylglutamate amidohydrolase n=1 Tax=Roseitranquillus sediminis TaxID=2809051 RepID=UPI001D0C1003|nr:N-formylglutamate amidohydrolase [Roseitranquillus sediminis]MBM9595877.1 N-formylglutamate amidohydrolase [Roseitranquillus sediminis]